MAGTFYPFWVGCVLFVLGVAYWAFCAVHSFKDGERAFWAACLLRVDRLDGFRSVWPCFPAGAHATGK